MNELSESESGWDGWPDTEEEEELRKVLIEHGVCEWKPFNVLYVAESSIYNASPLEIPNDAGIIIQYDSRSRYLRYLAEALNLNIVSYDRWDSKSVLRILGASRELRVHTALRVLREMRRSKKD